MTSFLLCTSHYMNLFDVSIADQKTRFFLLDTPRLVPCPLAASLRVLDALRPLKIYSVQDCQDGCFFHLRVVCNIRTTRPCVFECKALLVNHRTQHKTSFRLEDILNKVGERLLSSARRINQLSILLSKITMQCKNHLSTKHQHPPHLLSSPIIQRFSPISTLTCFQSVRQR